MRQQKRLIALLMCLGMALILFASSACVAYEAHHDCTGENCDICQMMARLGALPHGFALLGVLLLTLFAALVMLYAARMNHGRHEYACPTLVSWKIRLNN